MNLYNENDEKVFSNAWSAANGETAQKHNIMMEKRTVEPCMIGKRIVELCIIVKNS